MLTYFLNLAIIVSLHFELVVANIDPLNMIIVNLHLLSHFNFFHSNVDHACVTHMRDNMINIIYNFFLNID